VPPAQRFRLVLRTNSHVRLMERAGDDPKIWTLKTDHPQDGETDISIRDEMTRAGEDVPVHAGLVIVVDRNANSLEQAIEDSELEAARVLALLTAAGRAPTSQRRLLVAYEITPDARERRFRQWFWNTPFVLGKTPVPESVFGDLFQGFTGTSDTKMAWRLNQSLSWHQRALAETDAVARFVGLWIACEALEPRLRELFGVRDEAPKQQGILYRLKLRRAPLRVSFPGLKALADAEGAPDDLVKRSYTLRNDLFHSRRVPASVLVERARQSMPELEGLLPSAWGRLLGLSERTPDFPKVSVVPHAVGMFFDALLLNQEEGQWDVFRHPHLVGKIDAVRNPTDDPRDVSANYPTNFQIRNVTGDGETWRGLGLGIVGPTGPHVGTGRLAGPPEVVRATAT
jgi:Apea-like HEPN